MYKLVLMNLKKKYYNNIKNTCTVSIIILMIIIPTNVFAENQIFITQTNEADNIIFDGKWSFEREWKQSGLQEIKVNEGTSYVRISHQGEFVYVFIDVLSDTKTEKMVDKSIVCFDSKNNKSEIADSDDYCFIAVMGKQIGMTIQGGSNIPTNNYFKNIKNHQDMIAIGGTSDENDRYTKQPHASYEFKIPIELIGRSDNYGFYASVYDHNLKSIYSWPTVDSKIQEIPSPSSWGDLISPDKSIPEIPLPLMILSILFIAIIGITRKIKFTKFFLH